MKVLAGYITPAGEDEVRHWQVAIPLKSGTTLSYYGMFCPCKDHERLNKILEETGGKLPDGEQCVVSGHDASWEHIGEFIDEGYKIQYEIAPHPYFPNCVRLIYKKINKVYPLNAFSSAVLTNNKFANATLEDPNLVVGKLQNHLGVNGKSGIYLTIPASSKNIRIKKGNGVIDAGAYKFAYSERYITEDEIIKLECSYLKK